MLALAAVSFGSCAPRIVVYGYFNFPEHRALSQILIFSWLFRLIFGWIIQVVIIANITARLLIKSLDRPGG